MANAVNSRRPAHHDERRGCPQSNHRLQEYINKGLADFSPIVEIIRNVDLDKDKQPTSRLIMDFIRFRDLTAHKRVSDVAYLQMACAFVHLCRETVRLKRDSSPATTVGLPKEYARMADVNFVVCATWYFNILHAKKTKGRVNKQKVQQLARSLESYAQTSSFFEYHFTFENGKINVVFRKEQKQFDDNLLQELAKTLKKPVIYTDEEKTDFKNLFDNATFIVKTECTHVKVQEVLKDLEFPCTCSKLKRTQRTTWLMKCKTLKFLFLCFVCCFFILCFYAYFGFYR